MKLEITAKPVLHFTLTREQVEVLMRLSELHYDSHCRSAGRQGGFVHTWMCRGSEFTASAHPHPEVDTCCKLLESHLGLSPAQKVVAVDLGRFMHGAMEASRVASSWHTQVDVGVAQPNQIDAIRARLSAFIEDEPEGLASEMAASLLDEANNDAAPFRGLPRLKRALLDHIMEAEAETADDADADADTDGEATEGAALGVSLDRPAG